MRVVRLGPVAACAVIWAIAVVPAAEVMDPPPPATAPLLEAVLTERGRRFDADAGLLRGRAGGPGYHTTLPKDAIVHATRENADYAQLLLMRGQPADVQRAQVVLDRLLALQDCAADSPTLGLWGWYAEEPPARMAPADLNWADFIGARVAEILAAHEAALASAPDLGQRLRTALRLACGNIVRRGIGPEYTNICAMSAAVTLAAGRILGDPALVAYGRGRLAAQRAECERHGGVPEYNSPHYSVILIQELERILRLSDDPAARADAEWLRCRLWSLIAEQFHPGTGQWAGAHSRIYADILRQGQVLFLWQRTGIPPRGAAGMTFTPGPDDLMDATAGLCPTAWRERFRALPSDPCETEQVWMRDAAGAPAVVLHSWFAATACLGSVGQETTWVQHRPITGYWRSGEGVASLRLHLLKDGRDFASGMLRTVQRGPRLLTVLTMAGGQGDWHCSLDRPADGCFTASELRLRCALDGRGARITAGTAGGWILAAGDHQAVVLPGALRFADRPGTWEAGEHEGGVHLDAVLHRGGPLRFDPAAMGGTVAALALEVLAKDQPASGGALTCQDGASGQEWRWTALDGAIVVPAQPSGH